MSRKIIVVNPSTTDPVEMLSSATTWGQLTPELNAKNISTTNIKGIVKENKAVLELKDALLPEGDFTLYLFTDKNKAGDHGN